MKNYTFISLLLISLQFTACHKKNDPSPSWELVNSFGEVVVNAKQAVVYNNELILYNSYNGILYRYDINGKLIQQTQLRYYYNVQLYSGYYTLDSMQVLNDSLTVNSYTTSGNRYPLDLRSYLTLTKNENSISVFIPSMDATLPATVTYEDLPSGTTNNTIRFLTIYQPDTSNGQIKGITNINSLNLANVPAANGYGYKGNYIFPSAAGTYLVKSDGSSILTSSGKMFPLFVYQDYLYGSDGVGLYSTHDGTSWNLKAGNLNYSNIPVSNIYNHLLAAHQSGDLSEYHPESNTFSSLTGNGLGQVNGYILFGDYVYAYGMGLYRIKYTDLFNI